MKAFVLGHPIEHSLSPVLHAAAYFTLGADISYDRWDTDRQDFADRLEFGHADTSLAGYSVTMPLKKLACAGVQHASDLARTLGVANTVYWRQTERGRESFGHNTDVSGIVNALLHAGLKPTAQGQVAILGGGGTAISALVAASVLGYVSVHAFVRNRSRTADLQYVAQRLGVELELEALANFPVRAGSFDAAMCTLPPRAADAYAAELSTLKPGASLLDVAYDPWPSALALSWQKLGGSVVSGIEMLVYQALEQVKLFTGHGVGYRFEQELEVLNAMCRSVGLEERDRLPVPVLGL